MFFSLSLSLHGASLCENGGGGLYGNVRLPPTSILLGAKMAATDVVVVVVVE